MSARADAATGNYSKGGRPRRRPSTTLRAVAAGLAGVAVVLLVAAEFSTIVRVVVGSLETERRTVSGHANHGYALALVALAAVALTLVALRGSRAAAAALVALGAVALVVALAIDLPDTRASGRLPESVAFEDAQAQAGPGLGLEIAGGLALALAGILLVATGAPRAPRDDGRHR